VSRSFAEQASPWAFLDSLQPGWNGEEKGEEAITAAKASDAGRP